MEATATGAGILNLPVAMESMQVDYLPSVEKGIMAAIAGGEQIVREMCAHIAGSGGKRIRPQLVIHSGLAFSRVNTKIINTAVAAELIHMASLVHDDVIDRSALRRCKPSVNRLWGNHAAVLCGDWLFAQAFGILSGRGLAGNMRYMVEAIQCMCCGELLQAGNNRNLDIGLNGYYDLISKKTAKLLESCCKAGAAAGGAGEGGIKAMGEFGLNIGMAFQIVDDILDLKGSAGKMGKPKGEDLRQGVITLPVILLLKDGLCGQAARELLSGDTCAKAVDEINGLLDASGAIENAYRSARSFIDAAQGCLCGLPASASRDCLYELASALRRRES